MPKNGALDLSVIIPVHNEEGNIEYLYKELKEAINFSKRYEMIFVDDGSRDNSFAILSRIAREDKNVKVVKLRGNYGQTVAMRAGLDVCSGEKIITMDGDGQHHPKYIIDFYKKLDVYDVVCNNRLNRRKKTTPLGNFLVRLLFKVPYRDSIGGMKGFTKKVKEEIYLYGNMHRYLPLLARWRGFKVGEQEISFLFRIQRGRATFLEVLGYLVWG
ncbi:glycosyltransferase family 2 protein [Candidatus Pacearchaeota archaeon]|nr:glycosyltransferase family 2 protein [Candidatus Pacearchaeota archaeon]